MTDKTIEAYLVVDWKQGSTRTRATEPLATELGTNELVTPISLDVIVPEVEVEELTARIEVPEPRVVETEMADREADDAADWRAVADELLEPVLQSSTPGREWLDERDAILVEILQEAPGRPSIDKVKEHCADRVERVVNEEAMGDV